VNTKKNTSKSNPKDLSMLTYKYSLTSAFQTCRQEIVPLTKIWSSEKTFCSFLLRFRNKRTGNRKQERAP